MKKNLFVLILLCVISVINVNAGVNPAMRKEYDFKSFNGIIIKSSWKFGTGMTSTCSKSDV